MKLIYRLLIALLPINLLFMSCSDEQPFSVAGPSDEPHILAPTFPDRNNEELPTVATITRDENFTMELTVTPADYVNVVWYLDGNEVAVGEKVNVSLFAGVYNMKVIVTTTEGKSTSREGMIRVNPLQNDPWSTGVGFERIIAPGTQALVYGTNLELVKEMRIGECPITDIELFIEDGNSHLSYVVPADISEGEQRIVFIDADGMEYGAEKVIVSSQALITTGAERTTANVEWNMAGINLDKIVSFAIGGSSVTDFINKTSTSIQFITPSLEDGEYVLTGLMESGEAITFFKKKQIYTEIDVIVSSRQVLWEGHHYVSWDLPDESPNKTFNLIGQEIFTVIKPGSLMSIHYSVEPTAEYHQIRTTSGYWTDLPGTGTVEFSTDGVLEISLTQAMLDMIQEQAGFLCVGHGYYIDLITLK